MRRRAFLLAPFGLALPAMAQQSSERVLRVAWLASSPPPLDEKAIRAHPLWRHYDEQMRKRGWIEGSNLFTLFRTFEGKDERIPEVVLQLEREGVAAIGVGFISVAQIGAKAAPAMPFFAQAGDPLVRNVVQNLARPGGNINGIFAASSVGSASVEQKRLEILREMVPGIRRIAIVAHRAWWEEPQIFGRSVREAARKLGFAIVWVESTPQSFADAFIALRREKPDAVFFESSPFAIGSRQAIGEFAATSGIPSACGHQEVVEAGCLMNYNFTIQEGFDAMADFFDRIGRGQRAGEIPYRQYSRYQLAINLKTAKAISLKIPQSVLVRADRVIE